MKLRTYYWNRLKVNRYQFYKQRWLNPRKKVFQYGNAGDIFNKDLINFLYGKPTIENLRDVGKRLLLVGSVMESVEFGDIICGIGWKGDDMERKKEIISSLKVFGVRGPLTKSLFEKYGADLSHLKFELDPGLLIKEVYGLSTSNNKSKRVIFIPHFADFWVYNGNYPKDIQIVNIDNKPQKLAKEIQAAKVVYTSSLHGIIFCHALGKECVFVKPQTEEPIFKYKDYFQSVGIEYPEPIENIHKLSLGKDQSTILEKEIGMSDFYFPEIKQLKDTGIITEE